MHFNKPFSLLLLTAVILFSFHPIQSLYGEGQMSLSPKSAVVGSFQNVRFEFTVGASGLQTGGGIRFQLPISRLETEFYYWDRPQVDLPQALGYVKVSNTGDAKIQIKLYGRRGGIIECCLTEGTLALNDKIVVEYSGVVQSLDWKFALRTIITTSKFIESNYLVSSKGLLS